MVFELVELVTLKSDAVPVRLTVCVPPCTLSFTVSVPLRVPEAVGVNATVIVQVEPADNIARQLFVCPKSPLTWMLLMLNVAFPVFRSVTACEALDKPTVVAVKVRPAGVNETPAAEPMPVRLTD